MADTYLDKAHQAVYPIARQCRVLGVSTSGYYAWLKRGPSEREKANAELLEAIEEIHKWLHERGVSVLVGDAVNDVQPSGVQGINRPVHQPTQVFIGLPLVDNGYLEDVAPEAEQRGRWEFMVSWQISQILGGTAGPFNAIATF